MPIQPTSESIPCPDPTCPAMALIVDRWTWPSTHGPVEHVETSCSAGHVLTPPVELLAVGPPQQPGSATSPRRRDPLHLPQRLPVRRSRTAQQLSIRG
jgi:hypothetical protein